MNGDDKTYLLRLIAENDQEACTYLWNKYYAELLKFAVSYLKLTELAEEVVADVLFKVWESRQNIENIQNLRLYLFTSVRNRCYTQLNRQKREQQLFVNTTEFNDDVRFDIDPEKQMMNGELSKFISEIIEDLPPRCKQIYKMVREDGLRNKDVAAQLCLSVNTIDVQLAIALKKIVKALQLYYTQ